MRGIHVCYQVKDLDRRLDSDRPPEELYSILIHGEVTQRLPVDYAEVMVGTEEDDRILQSSERDRQRPSTREVPE